MASSKMLALLFLFGCLAVLVSSVPRCPPPFYIVGGQWCIFVNITAPNSGPGRPVTWPVARSQCQEENGDLVVLDNENKRNVISERIDQDFPDETKGGWVYWVGAQGKQGEWSWSNFRPLSKLSNLWAPGEPRAPTGSSSSTQYGKLVPADSVHGRRYLIASGSNDVSPGHICELR